MMARVVTNWSGRPAAREIVKVERVPYAATKITLSHCGHVEEVNQFYTWEVGETRDCDRCVAAWVAAGKPRRTE